MYKLRKLYDPSDCDGMTITITLSKDEMKNIAEQYISEIKSDVDNELFVRNLNFMGISNIKRMCGYIVDFIEKH